MKSDVILKGTKVDGIYDKDPINNSKMLKKYQKFLIQII